MSELDKNTIQEQIQELQNISNDTAKEDLAIAQLKIIALESNYYEKL